MSDRKKLRETVIKRDFLHFDLEYLKEFGVWIESSRGSVEGHHRKLKIFQLNR